MDPVRVERAPGGFQVDGLMLQRGKCGCGGLGGDCCFTYSKVRREGNRLIYEGKANAPSTKDNFRWGYVVRKGEVEVQVDMLDTKDPPPFFAGHYPPPLTAWQERGWQVVSQYEEPLPSEV